MTRAGIPLSQYPLRRRLDTQIQVESDLPGVVPEYECREAAVYTQRSWEQWLALEWQERAASVAHYRVHLAIEAHISDAQASKVK